MKLPRGKIFGRGNLKKGIEQFRSGKASGYIRAVSIVKGETLDCAVIFERGEVCLSYLFKGYTKKFGDSAYNEIKSLELEYEFFMIDDERIDLLRKYYPEARVVIKPEPVQETHKKIKVEPERFNVLQMEPDIERQKLLAKYKIKMPDETELSRLVDSFKLEGFKERIIEDIKNNIPFPIKKVDMEMIENGNNLRLNWYVHVSHRNTYDLNNIKIWIDRYVKRYSRDYNINVRNEINIFQEARVI